MTNILIEQPPNNLCEMIMNAGMRFHPDRTIFTYGNTIYNPANLVLSADLIVHEETHMRQQEAMGAESWWGRYLQEPLFRIQQEAEAYGVQWKYLCTKKKGRVRQLQLLATLAQTLAGPMYGEQITAEGAAKLIQSYAKL